MIKIIKKGKKEFTRTCLTCGCEFSYSLEDLTVTITRRTIKCPCCGKEITHDQDFQIYGQDSLGQMSAPNVLDNMVYEIPEYKQLQKALEKQVKQPFYVECNKSKSPCENCSYYLKLNLGETYVGDSPCQWCQYSGLKVTCTSTGSSANGAK